MIKALVLALILISGLTAWHPIATYRETALAANRYRAAKRWEKLLQREYASWHQRNLHTTEGIRHAANVWHEQQRDVLPFQDGRTVKQILDETWNGPTKERKAFEALPAKRKELYRAGLGGVAAMLAGVLSLIFL